MEYIWGICMLQTNTHNFSNIPIQFTHNWLKIYDIVYLFFFRFHGLLWPFVVVCDFFSRCLRHKMSLLKHCLLRNYMYLTWGVCVCVGDGWVCFNLPWTRYINLTIQTGVGEGVTLSWPWPKIRGAGGGGMVVFIDTGTGNGVGTSRWKIIWGNPHMNYESS